MGTNPYNIKKTITEEDLIQLRKWKNILFERKESSKKGSDLYVFFSDELTRVVNFLSEITLKEID